MSLIISESKHFAQGSSKPADKEEDVLRVYSMNMCPFAERARLVLLAKNLRHEIVNINLQKKPEWFLELNPQGKVPALHIGSKIIPESLDVSDYLDEAYSEPKLYPSDPDAKARDKELIKKFDKVIQLYYGLLMKSESKPLPELVNPLIAVLEEYENELAERGDYFGGSQPGMVDYMIWPFVERSKVPEIQLAQKLPIPEDKIARIRAWCHRMKELDVVKSTLINTNRHYKFWEMFRSGGPIDYDNL